MENLVKKVFLWWGIILLVWLLGPIMQEYMVLHPYYGQFLSGDALRQNLVILMLGVVCALVPTLYLTKSKQIAFWPFILFVWWWLWIFSTAYVGIKSDLFGGAWMKMLINSWFILWLGTLFFAQLLSVGVRINQRVLRLSLHLPVINFLFSLALGLVAFLSIQYVLLLLNIAFPLVNRLVWWGWVYLVWVYREELAEMRSWLMQSVFAHQKEWGILGHSVLYFFAAVLCGLFAYCLFQRGQWSTRAWFFVVIAWILVWLRVQDNPAIATTAGGIKRVFTLAWAADLAIFLLIVLFFWYVYNGFILAYIPYPTAWDANHAYMFFPKMFALHNGYYRNEPAMRYFWWIWLPYISYWFSLFSFSNGFLWISVDTIAIEMNFLSGIFVAFFGTWLMWALVSVLRVLYKDTSDDNAVVYRLIVLLWAFLVFQWISSGMGAFLVFIDNKTDMGVLALIIVALLSGFLFFREHLLEDAQADQVTPNTRKWLILSGAFFAFAVLAKPTATFDVLNFFLLLRWSRFGVIGVIGIPLLVMGALVLVKMRGVDAYFSHSIGVWLASVWSVTVVFEFLLQWVKKVFSYGKILLLWWVSFLVVMVWAKLLYYAPDALIYGNDGRGVKERIQTLLLASHQSETEDVKLAQNSSVPPTPATCSLQGEWLRESKELYASLKPVVGNAYDEDVGRYVWYGWKGNPSDVRRGIPPFTDPRWARGRAPGCYSFSPLFLDSHDAVTLCETEEDRRSFDATRLATVQNKLRPEGPAFKFVEKLKKATGSASLAELQSTHRQELLALEGIMQGESMKIVSKTAQDANQQSFTYNEVYVPYKYLNFFNITFNWSLQNLSSYYTDIGIVRLLLIFLGVVWLAYGIAQRERFLITIHVVTLFGWILWLIAGWGILWYGIGIIIWSILSFLTFVYSIARRTSSMGDAVLVGCFVAVFLFATIWQWWYNMVRISTQWGWGPFMWYKTNHGAVQRITINQQGQIIPSNVPSGRYGSDEVFALQFPHYSKFLTLINEREKDEGALIAGTYARYFIRNQSWIINDQFLTELSQWFSDNNLCRSYLRLQDKKIRYLAIDPNIGTVVQGDGNQGLFERFFARLNPTSWIIEQHGTMSMLAALAQQGYIRYVSSNNIWAKYALIMPNSVFAGLTPEQIIIVRAKMMIARFFQEQQLISNIVSFADQRVKDGSFFEDLADIIWLQVNPATTQKVMQGTQLNPAELTEDEKKVLAQFFWLREQLKANATEYQKTLQNLIMQSLWGGNQVIVMEVVE